MTQKRSYHRKLIRDNIPKIIAANGGKFETTQLSEKQYEKALKQKLLEESQELAKATPESMVDELADVLELIKSIASYHRIPFSKVFKAQVQKRKKRGGFKKRLFLKWSISK